MPNLPWIAAALGCSGIVLAMCPAASTAQPAIGYSVVALAPDTHSVVLNDPSGHSIQLHVGEMVSPTSWRVERVGAAKLLLRATQALGGQAVLLEMKRNEVVDLDALQQGLVADGDPIYRADIQIPGNRPRQ